YTCHPPDDTTETNTITYTVGSVMWDPPLPSAVTNSFTSQAYVIVTSSETNGCTGGRVNIGGLVSWVVSCGFSYYTTNCTPGTLIVTNVSSTTSNCVGSAFSASASHVISNAIQVITSHYTNACGH